MREAIFNFSEMVCCLSFFYLFYLLYALLRSIIKQNHTWKSELKRIGITILILFIALGTFNATESPEDKMAYQNRKEQEKYDKQAKYEAWMQQQADAELQKKYDDQADYEAWMKQQGNAELQKKYDDQVDYEVWMKQQENAKLQDAYENQAKYEEWMAWQASEQQNANESAAAERNKYTLIKADTLEDEYESNPGRAREHYKDQYVKISGRIYNISGESTHFIINGSTDSNIQIVIVMSNDTSGRSFNSLSTGEWVTVLGVIKDVGDSVKVEVSRDEEEFNLAKMRKEQMIHYRVYQGYIIQADRIE